MKQWKERARRLQAGVLAFAMCLSLAVTGVWAEESSGQIEHQKTDWTMTGDGSVGHKKTIRKTGENTFKITLDVKTKEEITKQTTSPDAAVVIVMDVSNSMAETVSGGNAKNEEDQRIYKAKVAAKQFIGDFAADAGSAQRQVALVEFGSNAMTVQDWTDTATAQGAVDRIDINFETPACTIQGSHTHQENTIVWGGLFHAQWRCTVEDCPLYKKGGILAWNWWTIFDDGYEGHTHERTYDGPHGKTTTDGGGTNIEAGLQLADNLLNTCPTPDAKKYVVLITDGVPTYHVYQAHYEQGNTNFIEGQKGGGNYAKESDYKNVPNVANSIKSKGPLYTVSYAASGNVGNQTIDQWLASFATKNVTAGGNIDWGLGDISETIKNQAKAWLLTDPIPAPYIVYKAEDNTNIPDAEVNPNSVLNYKTDANGTTLTWDLKNETATKKTEGGVNWYYYSASYTVHLDTTAENFQEKGTDGKVGIYPTNGTTTLTYMLTKDGVLQPELKSTNLDVPSVSGKIPTVGWTIEYYKQEDATKGDYANYTKANTETGTAKYNTEVKLVDKDPNYESKYNSDNYKWVKTDNASFTIGLDAEKNVIKVYYDRKTTSAVVNYHYTLTTIFENGKKIVDTYDVDGDPVTGLLVGEGYSVDVPETSIYGGYTYDFNRGSGKISKLDEDGAENVIDLYYVKTIDYRKDASVVVDHVYTLHTYELENGKYVAKDIVTEAPNVESETGFKAGETYTASVIARPGFNGYQYEGIIGTDNVKTLAEGENKITLNFENWEDPRGEELSLTVQHHYTKSETKIVNGEVVTTVDPDNVVGHTDTIKFYAGETVTIGERTVYGNDTYNSDEGNEGKTGKKVTTAADKDAVIDLYYTLTEVPEKTTVTVTHIYQTIPTKTVSVYTVGGDTEITTIKGQPKEDSRESDPAIELYVGQSHTATPKTSGNGYSYAKEAEENTPNLTTKAPGEIFIIYQRDAEEKPENENDAWIRETHIYYTNLKTIIGGEIKTIRVYDGGETIDAVDKVGTLYEAEQKLTFGENTYTLKTGEETVSKTLVKGDNGTIEFVYEREASDLANTSYTVNYRYYTRTMTVVDGVAVWGEPVLDTETTKTPTGGNGYVGQKVTLDTGAKDGYTAYGDNPSATQFLAESDNEWIFRYVKDVPLERVPVTVNHHITTKTLTIDGEFELRQDLMGRPEYKYKGEAYEAKALELGKNATLTLVNVNGSDVATAETITGEASTGAVVIDFYYEIVIDYRASVGYSIQYYYYDVDYDGTETLTGEPPATTGQSYVGAVLDINPEKEDIKGYKLTESTFNGNDIMYLPSVTLVEGENEIVYVYKRTVDTRPATSVKVIHEYYASANSETPAYTDEEIIRKDKDNKDLRTGMLFKATPVTTKNDVTYTQTTEDSALTITLAENAADNVITIKYVRADTTYTVVHEYYTDGTLTGSTSSVVAGTVGATITADGIAKVTTYGGNTYTYTSAAGAPLTLVQGENGTITLRYDRTTGGGGGGTTEDTYRLTIHYVYADGTTARDDYVRSGLRAGASYSRTSPTISGYTADITLVEGTMPARNVEVTVTYSPETPEPTETPNPTETPEPTPTPGPVEDLGDNDVPMNQLPGDVVDLWDEDVALTDLPEELEELSDDDVPLAQAPATGDSLLTWLSGALASGTGLLWLGGRKKREDEDDEI